jgi:glutathione S-transferase
MTAASKIQLWDLGPSPNSKKVRLALGYKGIPYEKVSVDPMDRSKIVEISGQPLAPVLVHGSTIMFDSGAILRYLDANVKREPRLFSPDYDTMRRIETWEAYSKRELAPHVGTLFGALFGGPKEPALLAKAGKAFNEAAGHIEKDLGPEGFLVGASPTAADVTCAAWIGLACLTPDESRSSHVLGFFAENLRLDPKLARVASWYAAVNRFDR